jgi:hypothetical protein
MTTADSSRFAGVDACVVFPDSNIFLHFRPLAQIDWLTVCGAKQVKLVVCLQVINELDDKKGDTRLSERAKRAVKDIREMRDKEIRPGVTLAVFNHALRPEDFPAGMSPDRYDDRIVRSVQAYLAAHPEDASVAVVTDDYGMELRCEAHGVAVVKLPAADRLEAPQDELTKKLRQAQAEVAALKNRLPALALIVVAKGAYPDGDAAPDLSPSDQMELLDVDEMLALMRWTHRKLGQAAHPLLGGFNLQSVLFKPDQIERFNGQLDDYFAEYEKYLHAYNEWVKSRGVIYDFDLYLVNDGNSPATDIEYDMLFPPCVYRLLDPSRDEHPFGQPPTPPQAPKEPVPFASSMLALPNLGLAGFGGRGFDLRLPDPHAPYVEILNLADHDEDMTGAVLRCHLRQLTHTKKEKLGSFSLAFAVPSDVKPFQADYSILSTELPVKVEGKLLFKFSDSRTGRE